MINKKPIIIALLLTTLLTAQEKSLTEGGMKCGAGKCGASMVDGNSIVAKKKKNILSQMREDDTRKECVLGAKTTKKLYDCLRNPKTLRVSKKCGNDTTPLKKVEMKCEAGKCGGEIVL